MRCYNIKKTNKIGLANVLVCIGQLIFSVATFFWGRSIGEKQIENKFEQSGITFNNYSESNLSDVIFNEYVNATNKISNLEKDCDSARSDYTKLKSDYDSLMEQYNDLYTDNEENIRIIEKLKQNRGVSFDDSKNSLVSDVEYENETHKNADVLLCDMEYMALYKPSDESFYNKYENVKDCTGEYHTNSVICGIRCYSYEQDTENYLYADYFLNKEYSKFKCKIVIPDEYKTCDDVYVVYFYGYGDDGAQNDFIAESDKISNGSLPYEYEISVENIVKFRIEVVRQELNSGYSGIALVDAGFYN